MIFWIRKDVTIESQRRLNWKKLTNSWQILCQLIQNMSFVRQKSCQASLWQRLILAQPFLGMRFLFSTNTRKIHWRSQQLHGPQVAETWCLWRPRHAFCLIRQKSFILLVMKLRKCIPTWPLKISTLTGTTLEGSKWCCTIRWYVYIIIHENLYHSTTKLFQIKILRTCS